jgi:hypothetical protein
MSSLPMGQEESEINSMNVIVPSRTTSRHSSKRPPKTGLNRPRLQQGANSGPNHLVTALALEILHHFARRPIYLHTDVLPQGFA